MNAIKLLIQEVAETGAKIRVENHNLKLSAPAPLPDELLVRLRDNKSEVLRFLSAPTPTPLVPATNSSPYGAPVDPEDWTEWVSQRRNKMLLQGRLTWLEVCKWTYAEAIEAWCGQHWNPPTGGRCAVCDKPNAEFNCGDGATVCRTDNYRCLIDYGTQRKLAACRGLSDIGLEAPEGWTLPDGSQP
jgi:hypothetical protein